MGAQASVNFLSTLGVKPMLGRDFVAGDETVVSSDAPVGPKVALLAYKFWQTRFGGDPHVVGRTMQLDASSVTIIGVLAPNFEFAPARNAHVWVALALHIYDDFTTRRKALQSLALAADRSILAIAPDYGGLAQHAGFHRRHLALDERFVRDASGARYAQRPQALRFPPPNCHLWFRMLA